MVCHLYSTDFSACMTLAERRRYRAAIQVYRVLHKLSPSYVNATFHYAVDITSRTGRNLYRLFVPRVQTTLAKHSFCFRGTQIWNSLNPTLYTTRKLKQFKSVYQSTNRVCMYVLGHCRKAVFLY